MNLLLRLIEIHHETDYILFSLGTILLLPCSENGLQLLHSHLDQSSVEENLIDIMVRLELPNYFTSSPLSLDVCISSDGIVSEDSHRLVFIPVMFIFAYSCTFYLYLFNHYRLMTIFVYPKSVMNTIILQLRRGLLIH